MRIFRSFNVTFLWGFLYVIYAWFSFLRLMLYKIWLSQQKSSVVRIFLRNTKSRIIIFCHFLSYQFLLRVFWGNTVFPHLSFVYSSNYALSTLYLYLYYIKRKYYKLDLQRIFSREPFRTRVLLPGICKNRVITSCEYC